MRYELTDDEWAAIRPMLPNKPRGIPRVNDRRVLNGIFWVLRSGAPWRDLQMGFRCDSRSQPVKRTTVGLQADIAVTSRYNDPQLGNSAFLDLPRVPEPRWKSEVITRRVFDRSC